MWLDRCPDCVDGRAGLVLLLLHKGEEGRWYDNLAGGECRNWRRAFGTRVVLSRSGVRALEKYFKDKAAGIPIPTGRVDIPKYIEQLNSRWVSKNRCVVETPCGMNYYVSPSLDLVDNYVIQEGLNARKVLWPELPYGVPGVQLTLKDPYESEEAWVVVNVSRRFAAWPGAEGLGHLLPCRGVLAWDNSVGEDSQSMY